MMNRKIIISLLLLLSVWSAVYCQEDPVRKLEEANAAYSSGDFSGAAALYRKLYDEGYRSETLLYNAGNAFYRSGDMASAILFYERARLLSPADEDIDYNLQIVRGMASDKFGEIPVVFLVRWFDFISLLLSSNTWALTALTSFVLTLLSATAFLTRRSVNGKVAFFWLMLAGIFLTIITLIFSIHNNRLINHNKKAVVMCSIVTGTSAPGETGRELFVIHSGTTVTTGEVLGDYSEVKLPDGTIGWIRNDCIEGI